ncbi:MAG: hypothetical protein NZ695_04645 [Dehalococcoidia bacterium]|nr:hypothetical protein [Dehalococcoidia bacterium]MDW8008566.1 hypothetical protein [Chloroflexota bacterium]
MRFLIALIAGLSVAGAVFGFAATNTVPATRAGDGANTISGYTVTNVVYTLDSTNPQNIASVSFDLDAAANEVRVRLQTGGTWFNCTSGGDNNWSCTTTGQTVAGANELRVVAKSN